MNLNTILYIYAALLIIGGFIGFKAGSQISLIMGLLSGAVVIMGVYLTNINVTLGYGITAAMSGLLIFSFLKRLLQTNKFMPSGMLLMISIGALIISLIPLLKK
jgi:uncharacterized membrane protein (UPF0136 family)